MLGRRTLALLVLAAAFAVVMPAVLTGAAPPAVAHPEPGDVDGDGVGDGVDNCPNARNGNQRDTDGDGPGDACDSDMDGDGIANDADNCPPLANADQSDNPCGEDADGDGRANFEDNCIDVANPDQSNNDAVLQYGDGDGDACDPDDDGDGVFDPPEGNDNCPTVENPDQRDADGDGLGYFCDADDTPPPSTPPPPPDGPGADTVAPKVTLSIARRHRFAATEGGLVVGVRCSEGCAATVRAVAGRSVARKLKLRRDRVAGTGAAQVERAARTYAFVRFPKAVKRKLWRMRKVKLTLRVEAVDRSGNRGRSQRAVTLRR